MWHKMFAVSPNLDTFLMAEKEVECCIIKKSIIKHTI